MELIFSVIKGKDIVDELKEAKLEEFKVLIVRNRGIYTDTLKEINCYKYYEWGRGEWHGGLVNDNGNYTRIVTKKDRSDLIESLLEILHREYMRTPPCVEDSYAITQKYMGV